MKAAGTLAEKLLAEAAQSGLDVQPAIAAMSEVKQCYPDEQKAEGDTFATTVAQRKIDQLTGGRLLRMARQPQTARRLNQTKLTNKLSPEAYQRALDEAAYQELVETLQGLQFDAISYLATPNTLVDGREPALASGQLDLLRAAAAPTAAQRRSLVDLDRLRDSIPRLVNLADPQSMPVFPAKSLMRYLWVTAIDDKTALADGAIVYHRFPANATVFRNPSKNSVDRWSQVRDTTGLLYVRTTDLVTGTHKLRPDRKVEPLILHARAGECIKVFLSNSITHPGERNNFSNLPNTQAFNINELPTTERVGIHAQSLRKHVGMHDGINVGRNPVQTVLPGQSRIYEWYAGVLKDAASSNEHRPIELGALNLMPADPVKQSGKGLFGAIIIQPPRAFWGYDWTPPEPHSGGNSPLLTRASLAVFNGRQGYRDFVLVGQNDANFQLTGTRSRSQGRFDNLAGMGSLTATRTDLAALLRPNLAELQGLTRRLPQLSLRPVAFDEPVRRVAQCVGGENDLLPAMCPVEDEETDAVDAGHKAFNYRSEAGWMRRVHSAAMPRAMVMAQRQHDLLSDGFTSPGGAPAGANQTPRFCAMPGDDVRVRVLFPNGHGRNHVIEVAGHQWDDQPFTAGSARIASDDLSEWRGTRDVVGPGSNWNLLLRHGAGGTNAVRGDYAIRDLYSWGFDGGLWAVLRVDGTCG